jgi:hypothetical protein
LTNISNLNRSIVTNDTGTKDHNNNHNSNNTFNQQMSIVNFSSYETALGFSNYALEKYYSEISKLLPPSSLSSSVSENNNNTTTQNYLKNLEKGLLEFNNAIKDKENPMKVMEIVHTKIHPNLQSIFNLKLSE